MVITKRYNSVEQCTSIHLSSTNLADVEQKSPQWIENTLLRRPSNEHLIQQTSPINYITPQYSPTTFQPQQTQQIPPKQPRGIMRPTSRQEAYLNNEFMREMPRPQSTIPSIHTPQTQFQQIPPAYYQYSPRSPLPKTTSSQVAATPDKRSIIQQKIPAPILLIISAIQIIIGLISLIIGSFNASTYKCMVEPNIPIYLIISGILLIIYGAARIFFWLSSDSTSTGRRRENIRNNNKNNNVCEYLIEGSVLFGIVFVVILGCFWVFGASRYMHNQRYMFEWHYCNPTVYWTAWWSVTLHLVFFALLILAIIIILVYSALLG